MKLVLHSYWRSSASHRVRIGLGLKGLAYGYVAVDIRTGGQSAEPYLSLNPSAQVPTLEVTEDDGTVWVLTQSLPILEYLEDRWPEPRLLPADPYLRARARSVAEVINSGIQPLQNLTTTNRVKALGGDDKAWVQGFITDGLAALEQMVADTVGRFCVGDTPSISDCCLIPQIYSATRFGVAPERFAVLIRIWHACSELPAFAAAHPDAQPDAVIKKI